MKVFTNLLIALLVQFSSTTAFAQSRIIVSGGKSVKIETYHGKEVVADQLLVRLRKNVTRFEVSSLRTTQNATLLREYSAINVELWDISASVDLNSAIKSAQDDPKILSAEPNYIQRIISTPNDPDLDLLWGLHNFGQTGGTTDADIDAIEAWDLSTGSKDVIVGVIDTGIDSNHVDLRANTWHNPGEIPGNGVDDDGNGYIDDINGWDFVNNDNDPFDDHGHGTHVSGTIGAKGDNGIGIVGVNWDVSLMALKFLNASGSGSTSDAIEAILYANAMGAHLTNNSWGGGGFSSALEAAIADADAAGILFIAASGNDGVDNDITPHYPSSYTVPNIISVAATDHNDALASFSNWGLTSVDLSGPGVSIYSTFPGNSYGSISGTSMATPHVSGVAALIWSLNPMLTHDQVRDHIFASVDPIPALTGLTVTEGRLNAFEALQLVADADTIAPAAISDLFTGLAKSSSVILEWTATGDDTTTGQASSYDMRYSTSLIDSDNFSSMPQFALAQDPDAAGAAESAEVTGLDFNTLYYFALKASDEVGNTSLISDVVSATTLGAPLITTNPDSLSDSLYTGASSIQTLWIHNDGEGYLDFSFPDFAAADLLNTPGIPHNDVRNDFPTVVLTKGEPDPRVGNPIVLGAGGPDNSGYTWIDSDEPGGPVYAWFDISGVGTPVFMSDDDYVDVTLPFTFDFYDNLYTSVKISSNGYLTFGASPTVFTNDPIPTTSEPNDIIAPFWDDLYPPTGGTIYYYHDTGANRFIVQYDEIWHIDGSGYYFFQVILYPSGAILYQYENMQGTLTSTTVGIENSDGSDGLQVAFNTIYIHNSLAVRITRGASDWVNVDPASGSVFEGDSLAIGVEYDATGIASGDYLADLVIAHNDISKAEVVVPAFMHVIGAPDIAVSDDTLSFGSLIVGFTDTLDLTFYNHGTDVLTVSGVSGGGAHFVTSSTGFSLSPGDSLQRNVIFAPTATGTLTGTLSVSSDDPDESLLIVELEGVGLATPTMTVTPDSISDSLYTGGVATHFVTITNTGTGDLDFNISVEELPEASISMLLAQSKYIQEDYKKAQQALSSIITRSGIENAPISVVNNDQMDSGSGYFEDAVYTMPAEIASVKYDYSSLSVANVAILGSPNSSIWNDDVQNKLVNTGLFSSVTVINIAAVTPSLAEMQAFDALLVYSDGAGYNNSALLGDNLADYVDGGGGVVCAVFSTASIPFGGRFNTDNYWAIAPSGQTSSTREFLGTIFDSDHPILNGVVSFDGGSSSFRQSSFDVTSGATRIADWTDGRALIATKIVNGAFRADLGFFPPSSDGRSDFWESTTDGDLILANALLWTSKVNILPEDWLSFEPDSGSVPVGGNVTVTVTMDAFGLPDGDYGANLIVHGNDPENLSDSVAITLHVTSAPDIAVSDATLDFDTLFVGIQDTLILTVYNKGTDALSVSSLAVTGTDYAMDISSFILAPEDSLNRTVIFTPSVGGIINETLTLTSNDPDEPLVVVDLHGIGVLPPIFSVSPESVSDALYTGGIAFHTVNVSNTGGSQLRFSISQRGIGGLVDAAIVTDKNGSVIRTGSPVSRASKGGPLRNSGKNSLKAARKWDLSDSRDISSSQAGENVRFDAGQTPLRLSPPEIRIPSGALSIESITQLIIYESCSDITEIQGLLQAYPDISVVDGWDATSTLPTLSDLLGYDGVIVVNNCAYPQSIELGNVLADYVDTGGGLTLTIAGFYNGWELMGRLADEGYIPFDLGFTIGGASLGTFDITHPIMEGVLSADGSLILSDLSVSATAEGVAFWDNGAALVATKGNVVGVNVFVAVAGFWAGDVPLIIHNAAIWSSIGSPAGWLSIEPDSGTVAAGGSIPISFRLDALGLSEADYSAEVIVFSNDPLNPSDTISVTLSVLGAPDIALSDSIVESDTTFVGFSSSETFMIYNVGVYPLLVSDIISDSADFSPDITSFTLEIGDSQAVVITFSPSDSGNISGTLTIYSDDPDEPTVVVGLSGVGLIPPELSVTPSLLEENVAVGDSVSQTFTINNTGGSNLKWTTFTSQDSQRTRIMTVPLIGMGRDGKAFNTGKKLNLSTAKISRNLEKIRLDDEATFGTFGSLSQKGKLERTSMSKGKIERVTGESALETTMSAANQDRKSIFSGPSIMTPVTLENEVAVAVFNESGTFSDFWLKDIGTNVIANPDLSYFATEIDPFISVPPDIVTDPIDTDGDGYFDTFTEYWTTVPNLNIERTIHLLTNLPVVEVNYSVTNIDNSSHEFDFYQALDFHSGVEYIYPPNSYDDLSYGGIFTDVPYLIMQMDGGFASTVIRAPDAFYSKGGFWNQLYEDPYYDPSGDDIGDSEDNNITDNGISVGAAFGTLDPDGNVNFQVVFIVGHTIEEANLLAGGATWLTVDPNVGVIPAGGSTVVTATADATGLIGGEYYGTIGISSNDPFNESDSVRFILHVTGIPDLTATPDTIDYGTLYIWTADTLSFTVTNIGTDRLEVDSLVSTHVDFTVLTALPFNLSPGEETEIDVSFAPSFDTTAFGQVLLYSNDPDTPVSSVYITGLGAPDPGRNYPPIVRGIPDLVFNEDEVYSSLDLDDYVVDFDTPIEDLNWRFTVHSPSVSTSERDRNLFTDAGITDNFMQRVSATKNLEAGRAPIRSSSTVVPAMKNKEYTSKFSTEWNSDAAGLKPPVNRTTFVGVSKVKSREAARETVVDKSPLAAESQGINVTIDPETHLVTLWGDPDWFGSMIIVLIAVDPTGLTDFDEILATVLPSNDAPVVNLPPGISFLEDSSHITLDLDDYVTDIDTEPADIIWALSPEDSSGPVLITINDSTHQVVFKADADWYGQRIITFIASDPDSFSSMDSLLVVVSPVNDAPGLVILLSPALEDTAIQNDTTFFEWHAVIDPDLDDVINYKIQFSDADDFPFEDIETVEVGEDTSIILTELPPNSGRSYWRVEARDLDGAKSYSEVRFFDFITAVTAEGELPSSFELLQNYPNPFNPSTTIEYSLPKAGDVSLVIYNLRGEEVTKLVNIQQQAGYYKVVWSASNVASGIYFYRLQTGDFVQTKKLMLLK